MSSRKSFLRTILWILGILLFPAILPTIGLIWRHPTVLFIGIGIAVLPKLRHLRCKLPVNKLQKVFKSILNPRPAESKVVEASKKYAPELPFLDVLTPDGYEAYCLNELRSAGWRVSQLSLSGNQPQHVVDKNGSRVAVQCTLSVRPVGSCLIEQFVVGALPRSNYGVVISNNRFTEKATALAGCAGIHLIHHKDLSSLEILLRKASQASLFAA